VLLVKHDQVVGALSAERPNHPLGDGVCLWRVNRGADSVDADASGTLPKVAAVECVPIPQEMAGLASPGRRFDQVSPGCCDRSSVIEATPWGNGIT
jgi:hypothetical protein